MPGNQTVVLVDAVAGIAVDADLIMGLSLQQIEDTEIVWRITLRTLVEKLRSRGLNADSFLEHDHWDWGEKLRAFGALGRFYGIERDGLIQGLMLLKFDRTARMPEQLGQSLVYVDYVETAPWNLSDLSPQPRFRGVGTALLKVAIQESYAQGCEGRIGLHSLPQAEVFYRRLGLTDLGQDRTYDGLVYFETTPHQAIVLLER